MQSLPTREYFRAAQARGPPKEETSELTFAQYSQIVAGKCAWCGSNDPVVVDRIDSTRHYYLANCQPLCKRDNQIKWSSSEREVWEHLIRLIKFRPGLPERAGYVKAGTVEAQPPQAVPADESVEPAVTQPQEPQRRPAPLTHPVCGWAWIHGARTPAVSPGRTLTDPSCPPANRDFAVAGLRFDRSCVLPTRTHCVQ
jgi:hypothetical protein